ncbi:MAG: Bro-N domain-containing protein, partial [Bacteroidaceae bacterium]|nr:Bro-N domain-containing protein [Bacteroidaceae bacterium]
MKEKNYQGEGCNYREYPYQEPARGNGSSAHDVHRRVKALGYTQTDKAIRRHVEEDDRMFRPVIDSMGRSQRAIVVNESGLSALILSSKLKEAKSYSRTYPSKKITAEGFSGGCLYPPPSG